MPHPPSAARLCAQCAAMAPQQEPCGIEEQLLDAALHAALPPATQEAELAALRTLLTQLTRQLAAAQQPAQRPTPLAGAASQASATCTPPPLSSSRGIPPAEPVSCMEVTSRRMSPAEEAAALAGIELARSLRAAQEQQVLHACPAKAMA